LILCPAPRDVIRSARTRALRRPLDAVTILADGETAGYVGARVTDVHEIDSPQMSTRT